MDGGDRLRMTLLDRMSIVESDRSSVTLEDVFMADMSTSQPQPPPSPSRNRSLVDVMRRDRRRDKSTWKTLRDKFRFKRNTNSWISSNLIPSLDMFIPTPDNHSHHHHHLGFLMSNSGSNRSSGGPEEAAEQEGRLRLGAVLAEERESNAAEVTNVNQPARMSLMELLEENDMTMYEVRERRDAEEEEGGTTTAVAESSCCVCMVRRKGAAFIPCGHTFCRLCSRELWVKRGNCPLCNTSILQVLDIF
ncbi:unnamed protein product [Cochlearia groenlandica]